MKSITIVYPFLIIALIVHFAACAFIIHTEIHLIPEGAQGDVFIVQGNPQGVVLQRELGASVFNIPSSRILVTQDPRAESYYMVSFYYVNEDGRREKLEYESSSVNNTSENRADQRPFVWFERDADDGIGVPCRVKYRQYYVGTRASLITRGVDGANADELRFRDFVNENRAMFCGSQ